MGNQTKKKVMETNKDTNTSQQEVIVTPASKYIADVIEGEMGKLGFKVSDLIKRTKDDVNYQTIRRIRKGSSGVILRNYEAVLKALNLRIMVVPVTHRDVIDFDNVIKQYVNESETLNVKTHEDLYFTSDKLASD